MLCLILIGFGLRVQGLDFQPLWGDEGWSFYFAHMPLGDMLAKTAEDIHPPLYYFLLHIWLLLAGSGPEVARFLSVVFGTLLIAGGSRVLSINQATLPAITAAAITALAPMAVYYSQEIRMYGLVTLLGLITTIFFMRLLRGQSSAFWPYAIILALTLYTMYFGVFIAVAHGVYWLLRYRRLTTQVRWSIFKAMTVAGVLYLPWAIFAGPKLAAYVENKISIEGYLPLSLPVFLQRYGVAFSLGHPSEAFQPYLWVAMVFAILAVIGWLSFRSPSRAEPDAALLLACYLLIPLILGWLVNLFSPFTPRFFERTLLLAAPAWWTLVGLGVIWLWQRQKLMAAIAASLLLLINAVSLFDFYGVPRYPEEDYRPMLAQVAAIAEPDDVLLASYQWQLGYYHAYLPNQGPEPTIVPEWGLAWGTDPNRMAADLTELLDHTVWFPAHQTLGRTWETSAEAIMADIGYPTLLTWANEHTKLSLVAEHTALEPGPSFNFQNQLQATTQLPTDLTFESGRGIVPVEIEWTKLGSLGSVHMVTLKLVDASGEIWGTRDSLPHAAQASFTDLVIGETLADRHGLLIPAGTPPGTYDLRLSVTDAADETPLNLLDDIGQPQGVEAMLTQITVSPPKTPISPDALARQTEVDLAFDDCIKLVGYSLGAQTARSGDILPVDLFWQSLQSTLPELTMFVQVQNAEGQALALTERAPVVSTLTWPENTLLRDLHKLRLPATIPPGNYRLAAGILLPDKTRLRTSAGDQVVLGNIEIKSRPHIFEPPQPQHTVNANFSGSAILVGYDLPQTDHVKPGQVIDLTLFWQGLAGFDRNWTIFAHIVDTDGRIWGQQDQQPGNGEFPTMSWMPDEYLKDTRQIPLKPETPPGIYFIRIGLYDASSPNFERFPVDNGDHVLLDRPIHVSAQ